MRISGRRHRGPPAPPDLGANGGDGARQALPAATGDGDNLAAPSTPLDHDNRAPRPSAPPEGGRGADMTDPANSAVDLGRLAWLATVFVCLIAVVILLVQGYYGYAGVTLAVAVSAGINLL